MGWVEIVETLKRIGSVPMPAGVQLYFTTRLNGLTFGPPLIHVECRSGKFDWHMERVPNSSDLIDFRKALDKFITAGGD